MNSKATKKCPFCGEEILAEAIKCRYCREFLEDPPPISQNVSQEKTPEFSVAKPEIPPENKDGQAAPAASLSAEAPGVSTEHGEVSHSKSVLKKIGCGLLVCIAAVGFFYYLRFIVAAAHGARFGEDPQSAEFRYIEEIIKTPWLKKAEQGDAEAQHTLGCAYLLLGKNEEAVKWLTLAAPRHALAAWRLAWCHTNGVGTARNPEKAFQVLKERVDAGKTDSDTGSFDRIAFVLGCSYRAGVGCEKNEAEAVRLFQQILPPEKADAADWVFTLQDGLGLNIDMAAVNIGRHFDKDALDRLEEMMPPPIDGNIIATVLGECYFKGSAGLPQDFRMAVKYLKHSDSPAAQLALGYCYESGSGIDKNPAEAVKWYRKAAEQGHAPAQFFLGNSYFNGSGIDKDPAEAVKWYRKAAEQGDAEAQYNLGQCYRNGHGVAQDFAEAVKWYRKAAEQGSRNAERLLKEIEK